MSEIEVMKQAAFKNNSNNLKVDMHFIHISNEMQPAGAKIKDSTETQGTFVMNTGFSGKVTTKGMQSVTQ
jgi:hypothetical protein